MGVFSGLQIPLDSVSSTGVRVLEPEVLGRFESPGGVGATRISATRQEGKTIAGVSVMSIDDNLVKPFDCAYTLGMGESLQDALLNLLISYHESLMFIRKIAPTVYALNIEGKSEGSPDHVINMLCQNLIMNPDNPMLSLVGAEVFLLKEAFGVMDLGPNSNMLLNGRIHRAKLHTSSALIVEVNTYQVVVSDGTETRWPFSRFVFGGLQRGVYGWFTQNVQFLEGGYLCLKSLMQNLDLSPLILQKGG